MPIYAFQGRQEKDGTPVSGMREAASHSELGKDLLEEGVLLTRFELQKQKSAGASLISSIVNHVPVLERLLFARYFALMLRAGLDVKQALIALADQSRSKSLKVAINGVEQAVDRGTNLADGMAEYPYAFPPLFISFVKVGETTGRLQESFEVLAKQLQKEYDLGRAVRGALMYPTVILLALIAVGFAMLVFVVPKLAEVFSGFDVDLPLPTRILMAIGRFFETKWWLALLIMFGSVILSYFLWQVRVIKATLLHWFLYMPVIGPIMQEINLARFTRNMGSLLRSGVSFVESLHILGENTPHPSYAVVFKGAEDHVKKGKLLSAFLIDFKRLFPLLVVNVIKVGEETGSLDEVLIEIAEFYESEVDQVMRNLTSIMEPILMVIIGLAVGALAISVISPIYDLVNVI